MMRAVKRVIALLIVAMGIPQLGFSQATPHLQDFFRQSIGLNEDQIAAIQNGQAVAKAVHSRSSDEIFLFGAFIFTPLPKVTFVLLTISTVFAHFRAISRSAYSAIPRSFLT